MGHREASPEFGPKRMRLAPEAVDRSVDTKTQHQQCHQSGGASSRTPAEPAGGRPLELPVDAGSDHHACVAPEVSQPSSPSAGVCPSQGVRPSERNSDEQQQRRHSGQDTAGRETGRLDSPIMDGALESGPCQPATPKPRKQTPSPVTPTTYGMARRHNSTPMSADAKPTIDKQCQTDAEASGQRQQAECEAPETSNRDTCQSDILLEERMARLRRYHQECNRVEGVFLRACLANGPAARANTAESIERRRSWLESEELAEMAVVSRLAPFDNQ